MVSAVTVIPFSVIVFWVTLLRLTVIGSRQIRGHRHCHGRRRR